MGFGSNEPSPLPEQDDGVTAIEYGLIAALITVVIIASLGLVGTEVETTFDTWTNAVHNAVTVPKDS